MKATPTESWLLPLACAPTTPQPRPSYTVPSPPTRKLKHTESMDENGVKNELIRRNTSLIVLQYVHIVHYNIKSKSIQLKIAFAWTVWAVKASELLTYIQCHQSLFRSYVLSECWQGGPYTLSGLCSLGGQCGVWRLSGQSLSKSPFVEGQPLPTPALKQCSLKGSLNTIKSTFKIKKSWLMS